MKNSDTEWNFSNIELISQNQTSIYVEPGLLLDYLQFQSSE